MEIKITGNGEGPSLLLIPGLGVSYEIFHPLISLLKDRYHIIAVGIDGFLIGKESSFTSIDDQAGQIIGYVRDKLNGHLDVAYGLSLGGKILSRIMEMDRIVIDHAILDAAPLLPLPTWSVDPLRYYQSLNVWTCYHWTGFWRRVFHSHYFDVLLDECRKVWPSGKGKAVRDGYKDVYTHKLESIKGADIHYWYGTKESFVAKPQARHLCAIHPSTHVEVFPGMNHGQFLIDHPEEVAKRIAGFPVIRKARPEDAPFLAKCIMAGMHFYDFGTEVPEKEDIFRSLVECERRDDLLYSYRHSRVAEADGKVVGALLSYPGDIYKRLREKTFAEIWPDFFPTHGDSEQETDPGEYYLDSLAVLPEYRGRGIGKALLQDGIRKGIDLGFNQIALVADSDMPHLISLYKSLGFVPADHRHAFGVDFQRMVFIPGLSK